MALKWRIFLTVTATGGYCTHSKTFWDRNEVIWWTKGGTPKSESMKRNTGGTQVELEQQIKHSSNHS